MYEVIVASVLLGGILFTLYGSYRLIALFVRWKWFFKTHCYQVHYSVRTTINPLPLIERLLDVQDRITRQTGETLVSCPSYLHHYPRQPFYRIHVKPYIESDDVAYVGTLVFGQLTKKQQEIIDETIRDLFLNRSVTKMY